MPRLKTKGDVIPVRLPLVLDQEVRERAESAHQTPSAFLSIFLARAWVGRNTAASAEGVTEPEVRRASPAVHGASNIRTPGCVHGSKTPLAGGLMRCNGCKRVRGADGVWR